MSHLSPLVRGYCALDPLAVPTSTVPAEIARGLEKHDYKLVDVVKHLQDALTSEHDQTRSRGVGLLSAVVFNMDISVLDRQTTKVLTTFFTTKLDDTASLVACCSALARLTESNSFGSGEGSEVIKGVFGSITLKAHAQQTRHAVYVLVDALMTRARPALRRLGREFISGYAKFVEGEKDPRNLMISFGIVRVILLEFEIADSVEDLFDITFCYFPITFTPPPDDPYGISSEDLIVSLRACLSATPLFGPLALPLFLDKLQATSEKAKRQTLEALTACFPIYGAQVAGEWAGRFGEALSVEMFHATSSDEAVQRLALETFESLFGTLYPDPDPLAGDEEDGKDRVPAQGEGDQVMHDGTSARDEVGRAMDADADADAGGEARTKRDNRREVRGIAVQVLQNSLDELDEPDKNNAKPALEILVSLTRASNRLASYVLTKTVPRLVAIAQDPSDLSLRPSALTHLAMLLSSLSTAPTRPSFPSTSSSSKTPLATASPSTSRRSSPCTLDFSLPTSPLGPYLDTLLALLTSCARGVGPSRVPALKGLVALVTLPGYLSEPEVEFCVSAFNDVVSETLESVERASARTGGGGGGGGAESIDEEAYELALDNLTVVSILHPASMRTLTLPILFKHLLYSASSRPSTASRDGSPTAGSDAYRRSLEALAAVSVSDAQACKMVMDDLSCRLERVVEADSSRSAGPTSVLFAHHVLSTLESILSSKVLLRHADVSTYLARFVPKLVALFVVPTLDRAQGGQGGHGSNVAHDVRLLVDVGKIVNLVLRTVDVEHQTAFYVAIDKAFSQGLLSDLLGEFITPDILETRFAPFEASSSVSQRNLIALFASTVLALRPEVTLSSASSASDSADLLKTLLERSLDATNELQLRSIAHILSSVVNKRIEQAGPVRDFVENDVRKYWQGTVRDPSKSATVRRVGLRVWIWIAKALVVRSDSLGYEMVEDVIDLFSDPDLGKSAAEQLAVVAEDSDKVLSKDNFSVVRLLYKQRFFTFLLPKLVEAHKSHQERQRQGSTSSPGTADQAVYLVALSGLLQHLPKQLALTELPKLVPLLITSLDLPSPSLQANVIDTLGILVREVPSQLEPSIHSITAKVLKAAVGLDQRGGKVTASGPEATTLRVSSLEFLALLPSHIPYLSLHPQKALVLRQLGLALDDPRRQVRRAAVECRSRWYSFT